jgi:DNA-binding MarR family transcriptional regulator
MSTMRPGQDTARAWMKLFQVQGMLAEQVDSDLKDARLPPATWYDALVQLRDAGPDGISQQALADAMVLPKHTISRLMDRFENRGLVYRQSSDEDRRVTLVVLKPEGQAVLKDMWAVYGSRIEKILGKALDQREQRRLLQVLERIERTLHQK